MHHPSCNNSPLDLLCVSIEMTYAMTISTRSSSPTVIVLSKEAPHHEEPKRSVLPWNQPSQTDPGYAPDRRQSRPPSRLRDCLSLLELHPGGPSSGRAVLCGLRSLGVSSCAFGLVQSTNGVSSGPAGEEHSDLADQNIDDAMLALDSDAGYVWGEDDVVEGF